jgi:hypothetical protein
MITVLCPACPKAAPCSLCGDRGVIDDSLLYPHEPRIRPAVVAAAAPVVRLPADAVPRPELAWFVDDDWIRFRDLVAAIPACIIAIAARLLDRRWRR